MKVYRIIPLVALILFSASAELCAQTLVKIGYSGGGVAKSLHKLSEKAGVWKKRGLDVRPIYFTSGATMAQAMLGGDIDIADSDAPAMLDRKSVVEGKRGDLGG